MTKYEHDESILKTLCEGDEKMITKIYHNYEQSFVAFIQKMFSCTKGKAMDIYPESFTVLYFNIKHQKLVSPLRSSLKTYLFSIGRHVFMRRNFDKYHRSKVELADDQWEAGLDMVEYSLEKKEKAEKLGSILQHVGESCKKLLILFYFRNFGYEAISEELGEPESTLRKRKYDCLKKLQRLIEEHKISF